MRDKYIEERFPRWFEFGKHPTEGTVDIADLYGDVVCGVSKETAAHLIWVRDAYVDGMVQVFMDDPDALYKVVGFRNASDKVNLK